MKKKDLTALFIVAVVSVLISIVLSGVFFSTSQDRAQKVEVVSPISTTFDEPDNKYFNSSTVNPAQNINVGAGQSSDPFGNQ